MAPSGAGTLSAEFDKDPGRIMVDGIAPRIFPGNIETDHHVILRGIDTGFPGIGDGVRGMAFIENVVASSQSDTKWHEFVV